MFAPHWLEDWAEESFFHKTIANSWNKNYRIQPSSFPVISEESFLLFTPPPPTSLRKSMQIIEMTHKVFEVIGFALLSGTKNKCSVFTLWITSCALIVCACLLDLAVLRNQSLGQCARMCPYMISGPMTSGDWPLDSSLGLLGRRDQGLKVLQDNANKVADGFVWDRTHV